jgi:hypothetical protein
MGAIAAHFCYISKQGRLATLDAARAFARPELHNHRYVMVLHARQANPHVHLSVRAEGKDGQRLNPRKADLRRWREIFRREAARPGHRG